MGSRPFPSLVASLTVVSLPPAQAPEGSSGWGGLSERLFRGFHTPSPPTGPNHVSLQQTAQSTLPTTSMSMSGSGHGSGPGYSHSGPASQSVPLQSQGAISNYVSRAAHPIPLGHPSAPALSTLYHASDLDWRSISGPLPLRQTQRSPEGPRHLHRIPRLSEVGGATCQKTPIVRSTLDKNPMPGHLFEGNPVAEGTTRRCRAQVPVSWAERRRRWGGLFTQRIHVLSLLFLTVAQRVI